MGFEPTPTRLQKTYPVILALIGSGTLLAVYIAEYIFNYEPCKLCLIQRIPYAGIAVIGWIGLKHPNWLSAGNLTAIAGFVFLAGSAIAIYHVGIEQQLWQSALECDGKLSQQISSNQLIQMLNQKPPKPCNTVDWTLFGISMATYNAFFSLIWAGITFNVAQRLWKSS
ncbi:MAG: hypothetical protein CMF69_12960 [Magnetovibrio sp.]|nr:hypothetical protein [Magnetovibrio sp.]